jgi:hypothetical protein
MTITPPRTACGVRVPVRTAVLAAALLWLAANAIEGPLPLLWLAGAVGWPAVLGGHAALALACLWALSRPRR